MASSLFGCRTIAVVGFISLFQIAVFFVNVDVVCAIFDIIQEHKASMPQTFAGSFCASLARTTAALLTDCSISFHGSRRLVLLKSSGYSPRSVCVPVLLRFERLPNVSGRMLYCRSCACRRVAALRAKRLTFAAGLLGRTTSRSISPTSTSTSVLPRSAWISSSRCA